MKVHKFSVNYTLNFTFQSDHDTGPGYQCSFCKKTFLDRSNHRTHERRHLGQHNHYCQLCGAGFRNTRGLNAHLATTHNMEGLKFDCPRCGKKFSRKDNMKMHLKVCLARGFSSDEVSAVQKVEMESEPTESGGLNRL